MKNTQVTDEESSNSNSNSNSKEGDNKSDDENKSNNNESFDLLSKEIDAIISETLGDTNKLGPTNDNDTGTGKILFPVEKEAAISDPTNQSKEEQEKGKTKKVEVKVENDQKEKEKDKPLLTTGKKKQ